MLSLGAVSYVNFAADEFARATVVLLSFAAIIGCKQQDPRLEEMNLTEAEARAILQQISAKPQSPLPPPIPQPKQSSNVPREPVYRPSTSTDWLLDSPVALSSATRSAAHPTGVLLIDAKDQVHLARLKGSPLSSNTEPNSVTQVAPAPSSLRIPKLGRGPAYDSTHVYWIRKRQLLRRPVKPPHEPLELLASDARVGTRVSVLGAGTLGGSQHTTWVQYIAVPREKRGPLRAKLWHGGEASLQLSPEASSILTAGLIRIGQKAYFMGIEARTGMSALHARQLMPAGKSRDEEAIAPTLSDDKILWFGPNAQPWTELKLARGAKSSLVALLAQERDSKSFGLLALPLVPRSGEARNPWRAMKPNWEIYPNGLDPAPLAAARVCGKSRLLLVRPIGPKPRSPQELMMADLVDGAPKQLSHIATAKVIFDVSVATLPGGALVSYVADRRVWAQTIRCRK